MVVGSGQVILFSHAPWSLRVDQQICSTYRFTTYHYILSPSPSRCKDQPTPTEYRRTGGIFVREVGQRQGSRRAVHIHLPLLPMSRGRVCYHLGGVDFLVEISRIPSIEVRSGTVYVRTRRRSSREFRSRRYKEGLQHMDWRSSSTGIETGDHPTSKHRCCFGNSPELASGLSVECILGLA